jgi:hypothetical protein
MDNAAKPILHSVDLCCRIACLYCTYSLGALGDQRRCVSAITQFELKNDEQRQLDRMYAIAFTRSARFNEQSSSATTIAPF